jgi:hypothetical protein
MSESAEQLHKRLCSVIAAARFEVLFQPYAWEQVSEPSRLPANALAVVRDGSAWYALTSTASLPLHLQRPQSSLISKTYGTRVFRGVHPTGSCDRCDWLGLESIFRGNDVTRANATPSMKAFGCDAFVTR